MLFRSLKKSEIRPVAGKKIYEIDGSAGGMGMDGIGEVGDRASVLSFPHGLYIYIYIYIKFGDTGISVHSCVKEIKAYVEMF